MTTTFDAKLNREISKVFAANPDLPDHRSVHPWLTGALGVPESGIVFLAENPSLSMVERATNPGGGAPTEEAQWYASKGDRLFREALVIAGFKSGSWDSLGGWRCYITNVIKQADYAEAWKRRGQSARHEAAEIWSPILKWQLEQVAPRLVVTMGNQVDGLVKTLAKKKLISLPPVHRIDHYSYVALRPRGKLGPMHPERVAAYRQDMLAVRDHFASL
jgi:uracil-DNA glycosylase